MNDVSKELCDERHGNIEKRVSTFEQDYKDSMKEVANKFVKLQNITITALVMLIVNLIMMLVKYIPNV